MIMCSVALTEADLNSPFWRLVYIGVIGVICIAIWVLNRYSTTEHTKPLKALSDQSICPECDSDETYFDISEFMIFPLNVTCRKCGHEWWWTPPYRLSDRRPKG
jgi:hypothetical protein